MEKNAILSRKERIEGSLEKPPRNFRNQLSELNPVLERLTRGNFKVYADYVEWLGLADDPNIIVLSPSEHYYYDDEDLKEVTTILNLKHLNYIREVRNFVQTINQTLPGSSFFVGSFIDKKNNNGLFSNAHASGRQWNVDPVENGITSRIPILNLIYDFMDSRTNNRSMTGRSVTLLLESAGLKVIDMTEIGGITYFCAQKVTSSGDE
jgi:hypothetical protein